MTVPAPWYIKKIYKKDISCQTLTAYDVAQLVKTKGLYIDVEKLNPSVLSSPPQPTHTHTR